MCVAVIGMNVSDLAIGVLQLLGYVAACGDNLCTAFQWQRRL